MPIDAWARCCRPWPPPPPAAPPRGSDATREAGGDRHASRRHHPRHRPRLACCCDCRAARWHRPQPTGDWERERLSQRRWRLHWPAAVAQRPTWLHSQTSVCAGACVLFEWCAVGLQVCGDGNEQERRAMSTRHVDGGGCCCLLLLMLIRHSASLPSARLSDQQPHWHMHSMRTWTRCNAHCTAARDSTGGRDGRSVRAAALGENSPCRPSSGAIVSPLLLQIDEASASEDLSSAWS